MFHCSTAIACSTRASCAPPALNVRDAHPSRHPPDAVCDPDRRRKRRVCPGKALPRSKRHSKPLAVDAMMWRKARGSSARGIHLLRWLPSGTPPARLRLPAHSHEPNRPGQSDVLTLPPLTPASAALRPTPRLITSILARNNRPPTSLTRIHDSPKRRTLPTPRIPRLVSPHPAFCYTFLGFALHLRAPMLYRSRNIRRCVCVRTPTQPAKHDCQFGRNRQPPLTKGFVR